MKKILLFVLILIFPCYIFAAPTCDYEKKNELSKLANDITYETTYVKSKKTFTITLYNMIKGLALEYDGTMYSGNDKNIITLTGINEGTTAEVVIKVSGLNCDPFLRTLYIKVPYYNKFYGSRKCDEYIDKLSFCKQQFLSYELTEEIIDNAIKNLDEEYYEEPDPKPEVPDTPIEIILEFVQDYGIKIALISVSSLITIGIFNVIFRKIKHKI